MPSTQPFLSTLDVEKFSTIMEASGEATKLLHIGCGEVFHIKNK